MVVVVVVVSVSLSIRASPFGWTDPSRKKKPTPVPSEGRFQAPPGAKPNPTPSRGKRLRGPPSSPSTPSEEGGRNLFHLLGVGGPGSGMTREDALGRVLLVNRTRFTKLPLQSRRSPDATEFLEFFNLNW